MTSNVRGRRTVAAIETAALTAADDLGAATVTVKDICALAGVSERVFFNHFATREDAFLGQQHPSVDVEWAHRYATEPDLPLIEGAVRLVRIPPQDAETRARRRALIAADPQLLARTYALLTPVREQCRRTVAAAARRRHPELGPAQVDELARVIVAVAAELLDHPPQVDHTAMLRALRAELPG